MRMGLLRSFSGVGLALALSLAQGAWGAVPPTAATSSYAPAEVVGSHEAKPCRSRYFYQPLAVYRDPSLFLGSFAAYVADPRRGLDELLKERPLLTRLVGEVAFRELPGEHVFKSFPVIQQMYADVDRRFLAAEAPKIVFVVLCGEKSAYRDTMGFVLQSDLLQADRPLGGLPPSIEPNPVPQWRVENGTGHGP